MRFFFWWLQADCLWACDPWDRSVVDEVGVGCDITSPDQAELVGRQLADADHVCAAGVALEVGAAEVRGIDHTVVESGCVDPVRDVEADD